MQQCLMSQEGSLSWVCRMELYREEMEQSDDLRLSLGLMRACMDSKQKVVAGRRAGCWRHALQHAPATPLAWCKCLFVFPTCLPAFHLVVQFCEGVAPGESNTKDCLELHM